jgi:hypothetical protein
VLPSARTRPAWFWSIEEGWGGGRVNRGRPPRALPLHARRRRRGHLSAGLDLPLARDAKNKALVEKPRSTLADAEVAPGSDHVPAAVEREARKRDGDRCQWPLDSGGICGSRFQIQLDHIIPKARGGRPVIGNLRLLCEPHNKLAAWQKLGHGLMNRYCRDPRLPLFAGLPGDTSGG